MAWYDDELIMLGAPNTNNNRVGFVLWAESEGMPDWENNWLATTQDGFGGYNVNGVGVKAYPTYQDGLDATYATLTNGYYSAIISAFQNDAGLEAIWRAINGSPWCAGCQDGKYPIALYNALGQSAPVIPSGTPQQAAAGLADTEIAANAEWEDYRAWSNAGWLRSAGGLTELGTLIDQI